MGAEDHGWHAHDGLPEPGAVVGSYTVVREIGRGGMAAVFEARHQSLPKRVALKMLLPQHAARGGEARRFMREGEAVARLNHPNAVDVTDVGTDTRGLPYLVMEFLEGEDLAALIDRRGKLSITEAADILVPVISAIAAAHDLGIVHRDLKPHNIFLSLRQQELVPKVLDFGISKVTAESMKLTNHEAILGTPHYMSPEQAQGASDLDGRSDQFSLGVLLYEAVSGKRPFDSESMWAILAQIIHGEATPVSKVVSDVPPGFEAIIQRAMKKDPAARYPDMRKLGARLLEYASVRTQLSYRAHFGLASATQEVLQGSSKVWDRASMPDRDSAYARVAHAQSDTVPGDQALAPPPASRRKWPLVGGLLGIAIATVIVVQQILTAPQPVQGPPDVPKVKPVTLVAEEPPLEVIEKVPERFEVHVSVQPSNAVITLDGEPLGHGTASRSLDVDGVEHVLSYAAPNFRTHTVRFTDRAPAANVTLEKLPVVVKAKEPPKPEPAPVVAKQEEPAPVVKKPVGPGTGTNGAVIME